MPSRAPVLCLISWMALVPGPAAAQPNDPDLQFRLGIVAVAQSGAICFSTASRTLAPGDSVGVVSVPVPGEPGVGQVFAAVVAPSSEACSADSAAEWHSAGNWLYALRLANHRVESGRFYFGVIAAPHVFRVRGRSVTADLGVVHPSASFRQCTSQEGVHLTVWSGPPLRSQRLWHEYVHLDFDTQPRCVEADY